MLMCLFFIYLAFFFLCILNIYSLIKINMIINHFKIKSVKEVDKEIITKEDMYQ